ncbi:DUF6514 family protein [Oscillibacter sp. PC13]|jgi:hypothetical protein|uniref:DUF6514 family protein n=1 Tax=Oscillibacter sp. PC13 TaxID=1855299 RepID=UPI000B81A333|nr:DUF6514 family protein [Oscillibacter sp. PC13]
MSLQKVFIGRSKCKEAEVNYYLLSEELEDSVGQYGLCVECGEEAESILRITESQNAVLTLLSLLASGGVTPIAVRDVVEDWLLM